MKRNTMAICVLAAAIILGAYMTGQAQQAGKRSSAVAAMDVEKVFNNLQEKTALEADLQGKREQLKLAAEDKAKELRELQQKLELLVTDQPEYSKTREQIEFKVIEFQVWKEFNERQLNRDRANLTERLYKKILDAVERVCKQNGYDMALFKERTADFKDAKPEQLPTLVTLRKVLWSSEELDITGQVTDLMNNEFKQNKRP